MVLTVGRVCVKIAGRDAGKRCVIIKEIDGNYVFVDGETRRRKVNKTHLEPLDMTVSIKENASNDSVVKALQEAGVACVEKPAKDKKEQTVRMKRQKAVKKSEPKPEKKAKKSSTPAKEKKAKPKKSEAGDEE